MASSEESKKLERRARSLLMTKEISKSKMDLVRSLMSNTGLKPEERFRTIIGLLQSCPDREAAVYSDRKKDSGLVISGNLKNKNFLKKGKKEQIHPGDHSPTETSFYIDELNHKFRRFKLFKTRYPVHRKNRFNLGFRKRLIPSRKFLKVLADIFSFQDAVMERLPVITMDILDDDAITDPSCFNYLRLIRTWISERPLAKVPYDSVKWMERINFEWEFKQYISYAFSFQRLGSQKKEEILKMVESKLVLMPDLKKDPIPEGEKESVIQQVNKRNMECDRRVTEYLRIFRSFLFSEDDSSNAVTDLLREKYNIPGFNFFLMMVVEVLIYQRPVIQEDFVYKFEVRTPEVSYEEWNYSEDYLKKIGKDSGSRKQKKKDEMQKRFVFYDDINSLVKLKIDDKDIVVNAVGIQWRNIDRNRNNPETVFMDDFPVFIDGAVQFFNSVFLPFINGTRVLMHTNDRKEIFSPVFGKDFFDEDIKAFKQILEDLHKFRSDYPMLVVSRDEAVRIMRGQISSMDNVEHVIRVTGNFFYNVADKLFPYYESHRQWSAAGKPAVPSGYIRTPLSSGLSGVSIDDMPLFPLPFYDCTVMGFDHPSALSRLLENTPVAGENTGAGVIGYLLAFCYQMAGMCSNSGLSDDLITRDRILSKINGLEKM